MANHLSYVSGSEHLLLLFPSVGSLSPIELPFRRCASTRAWTASPTTGIRPPRSRAVGGAGLVMVEATAVEARGHITYGDLGIWKDEHIDFLRRIATFIKSQGAVPGIQLAHAGRKASCQVPWDGGAAIAPGEQNGWQVVARVRFLFGRAIRCRTRWTSQQARSVVCRCDERALAAGFEVIEIHGAHGYLINEFLSPLSNHRTDEYGQDRTRFAVRSCKAVRARCRITCHSSCGSLRPSGPKAVGRLKTRWAWRAGEAARCRSD